jgi:ferredoxin
MTPVIDEKKCVGCGICAAVCPREAIRTYGIAAIDENKCSKCYGGIGTIGNLTPARRNPFFKEEKNWRKACLRNCPARAVKEMEN